MSKEILQSLIENFDLQRFRRFFSEKNKKFRPSEDNLDYYCDDNFSSGQKLGELYLKDGNLLICAFKVKRELSERSGKKAQYNLGKAILKGNNFQQFNAGIFIFYDKKENFRFSLIYDIPKGIRRDWNNFRRFTYFVSKEFTNKTFLQRIGDGDFSSLGKIKDSFSVEKVTKEFYKDVANWYFWAVQNVKFPKDAEAEKNGRNIAVIRLITRIIFIWFMRERGLVPRYLFDRKILNNILKNTSPEKSTYYLAILQNLFFATLNTKKTERNFNREWELKEANSTDYGDYNGYRYHELFKDSARIYEYFGNIPFLNGGLFECLDDKSNGIIIDGFSDNQKDQPQIPNYLFFSGEIKSDLNIEYGTKNKSYKVRGLIDTLSSYNFTIDENDLDDQEVALDPELLGRVFENLLASFNPETSTTARKATGSYYTPREIVNYMVTESLKQYFKTHLQDIVSLEEKLEELFSKNREENPFNGEESERIVKLIESLRMVDPAVGSGAFPMGVLNKLVFILSKIDPRNLYWKKVQINAVKINVVDSVVRQKLIDQIEKQFQEKNIDYGRKLFLIQKCIYGVDIQQIAVEIARLRFFISLLVNEKIDWEHPDGNCGIQPLPNLDFKIMQGNSLISEFLGIDFDKDNSESEKLFSDNYLIEGTIKDFEQKKSNFQSEQDRSKKEKLKEDIEKLIIKILNLKLEEKFPEFKAIEKKYINFPDVKERKELIEKEKQELSEKIGFDIENAQKQLKEYTEGIHAKPFFLWKLYFAEVFQGDFPGFDIVIGNPPYIDSEQMVQLEPKLRSKYAEIFTTAKGNWDIFVIFIEKGIKLLKNCGSFAFIIPNKIISAKYTAELRKFLLTKTIKEIRDYSRINVFIDQDIYPVTLTLTNKQPLESDVTKMTVMKNLIEYQQFDEIQSSIFYQDIYWDRYFFDEKVLNLLLKLWQNQKLSGCIRKVSSAATVSEAYKIKKNLFNDQKEDGYKLVNTGTIDRYKSLWGNKKTRYIKSSYLFPKIKASSLVKINPKRELQARSPKIIIAGMSDKLEAFLDRKGEYYAGKSTTIILGDYLVLQPLIAIINSKLLTFFVTHFYHSLKMAASCININTNIINNLPIPPGFKDCRLIRKVNQLINVIEVNSLSSTKELECQIDKIIYGLYELTAEEIKIVENSSK